MMAELPQAPETLTIMQHKDHGAYLEGRVAQRVQVTQTLLDAIQDGNAPFATYRVERDDLQVGHFGESIRGLKSGTLTFELANVQLVYAQIGAPFDVGAITHYEFVLTAEHWKRGAVVGEQNGRRYGLVCRCERTRRLLWSRLATNPFCALHGDERHAFKGEVSHV